MRRTAQVLAAVLVVMGFLAPSAQAQTFCLDFDIFCDGLELSIDGDLITGYWRNRNCDGFDSPVVGLIQDDLPRPCNPGTTKDRDDGQWPGIAGVACTPELGCGEPGAIDYYFVFDGKHSSLDMGRSISDLPPPGACFADEVAFTVLLGPCPFFGPGFGKSSISSEQAALTSEASP